MWYEICDSRSICMWRIVTPVPLVIAFGVQDTRKEDQEDAAGSVHTGSGSKLKKAQLHPCRQHYEQLEGLPV